MSTTIQSGSSPFLGSTSQRPGLDIPELRADAKPKRCCAEGCKKKLGMLDFVCKCGLTHCAAHRHAENHGCTYDYKMDQNKFLSTTMGGPVVAKKVEHI